MKKRKLTITAASVLTLAGMAALTTGNASAASGTPITSIAIITPGAPMNPFNANGITWEGLDRMQLAFYKYGMNSNDFWPSLAQKWTINKAGNEVKIELRKDAKWSDGKPVTADDVKTTMALDCVTGNNYWNLGSVETNGKYEVTLKMIAGSTYRLFANYALQQDILPAHVYGSLLPSNVWELIQQSQYNGSDKDLQAQADKANQQLTAIGTKVSAFAPKEDVTFGPFKITGVNGGEAVLTKNPTYWDAKKIKVNSVVLRNYSSNQNIWDYMIGGQVEQATSAMPTSIKDKAAQTSGNQFYTAPSYYANSLMFNQKVYPYNMLAVRQALAYAINRDAVQQVGEPVSGSPSRYITGMIDSLNTSYLKGQDLASINQYKNNTQKAEQLLKSAGFKKGGDGNWIMPNGKPWTATINVNASFTDWVQGASVMANQMTQFGIPTQPSLVPEAQYATLQSQGKFGLSFYTIALGPDPYKAYRRIYGAPNGNSLVGTQVQHNDNHDWNGFPSTVTLPGYGKVNPGELTYDLIQTTDVRRIHKDTIELAEVTNKYLPCITTWNGMQAGFINTSRFTNFPTNNKQVVMAGAGFYPPIGFWMDMGYITPKN